MNDTAPKNEGLKGIEFRLDGYSKKPCITFGYGKRTCSLIAPRARHLLRAIEENGAEAVCEAIKTLLANEDKPPETLHIAEGTLVKPETPKPKALPKKPPKPAEKPIPKTEGEWPPLFS